MDNSEIDRLLEAAGPQNWYQRFELVKDSGIFTPGIVSVNPERKMKDAGFCPDVFKGKRVLDIGADAGGLSFYLEECGASIVALDPFDPDKNGFNVARAIRGSNVEYRQNSVYDLNQNEFGQFDIVMIYAVLRMLKHPLLALERINSICKPGAIMVGVISGSDLWFPDVDVEDAHMCGANFKEITKRKIRSSRIMTANNLNEIPLCGFTSPQYRKHAWFIPNKKCLDMWFEVSGFKTEQIQVTPATLLAGSHSGDVSNGFKDKFKKILNKYKNRIIAARKRATLSFRARCVSGPSREMDIPGMQHFEIPARIELVKAKAEIAQLKEQLQKYSNK